jgi:hypothetical protein
MNTSFTIETAGKYIVQFCYSYKPKKSVETSNKVGGIKDYEK